MNLDLAAGKLCVLSLLLLGPLVLSSCANMPKAAVAESSATVAEGYGRAFGQITQFEDGQETKLGGWTTYDSLTLLVRSVASGEMQRLNVERDGSFFWPLKSGDYVLAGYFLRHGRQDSTIRLWLSFSVSEPGQAVYVGHLLVSTSRGHYRVGIVDNYDEALKKEQKLIDSAHLRPVKGLMLPEKEPGEFRQLTNICAPTWGITCDKTYQGVEPIRPKVDPRGYPLITDTLTPVFEWKPSTRQDITYDIEIYETLNIGPSGESQGMRGQLVAYKQGLREPRFVAEKPFLPGSTYQWSVRLRDGDTVSTWSTTSYFSNLIIVSSGTSGNYFAFSTPKK